MPYGQIRVGNVIWLVAAAGAICTKFSITFIVLALSNYNTYYLQINKVGSCVEIMKSFDNEVANFDTYSYSNSVILNIS
jgi:hypothetical protein